MEVQVIEMTHKSMWISGWVVGLASLLGSGAPAVFADDVAGHVTASLESQFEGPIAEGEHVRLGESDACSILLDDDAVVELCGNTSVVFTRDRDSNRRIVSLDGGEIRIVVEPRAFEERIEIHTPAAIATLLGTIAHVAVDPKTGRTTITSTESRVSVRSDQPAVRGTTVLEAGEQVSVEPGGAPPAEPRRLDLEQISTLGGCLVNFHTAAADRDSRVIGERTTGRLTAFDAANAGSLPGAAAPSERPGDSPRDEPGDPLTGQEGVCVVTDCAPHENPQDPTRF